jgi:hypothetical protein
MTTDSKYTLPCKHSFCYDRLVDSFKGEHCNYYYSKTNNNHRICPYCRAKSGYLPIRSGYKYTKSVHCPADRIIKKIPCKGIYKTGKSAGQSCKSKVDHNIGYCKRHLPKET